ncbi:MAG: hypothetical protein QW292_13750, partial [Candidatus Parvarchaeota archaeon]
RLSYIFLLRSYSHLNTFLIDFSIKRLIVERPYVLIKSVFHGGHVLVTTVIRIRVKAMFM